MNQQQWTAVDDYFNDHFIPGDPVLAAALHAADQAGLPPHNVSPAQGKLLAIFARMIAARHILEIGTLAAYSTIWMARTLPPEGRLITLEADPNCASVARSNLHAAGLADRVELRLGPALTTLPQIAGEIASGALSPFDLIFIDADKPNNPDYLAWSLKLSRPGTVIIGDNVVREGAVLDAGSDDPRVQGVRRFNELLATDPRLMATAIQTVGSKGYDGFAIAIVQHL